MEWWRTQRQALTRDYFRVEDEAGLRFWLYRDGLYGRETRADDEGKPVPAELVRARAVRMNIALPMPRSASPRISRSCAAARIRRTMCIRRASCGFPSSASPITTRWPAWCGPTRNSTIPSVIHKPKLLIGSRLVFIDGTPDILVYPRDRAAYGRLCQLLTRGKRGDDADKTEKGECHLKLDDLLEFAEGQLLVLTLPHRFEAAKALEDSGSIAAQPRRWRVACGQPAVSRRRQTPPGAAAAHRRDRPRAAAGDQRGAVSPSRAPSAAGCADLHPRKDHHRGHRQAPRSQCRTPSQAGAGNGAAVSRLAGGDRGNHAVCRSHRVLARSAQISISRRAGAAGQDRAAPSGRPDLGRR